MILFTFAQASSFMFPRALSFITLETVAVDTFAIRAMSFREIGIDDGFPLNVNLNRLRN